ncbi:uncharacterized protein At2g33490-like isoform X2 [Asparagus officinalis]|nr:uncharacterized protein At2g33490-like isoform X2 [Asparagus officinalis]
MGTCLLEKTALNEDEDSGRVLLMLGKVQFELQKLVDSYRAHIVQTITTPSESLLKELQTVEEMKQQCDEKRDLYKTMLASYRQKGRLKHVKGESFSSQQLQEAHEDYEEEANQFVFRLKSLKQGQSRSLLTQAARHHAAQLNFFRKGLKYLEDVEPHVKIVAEHEHIDYQFSGLEDDDTEDDGDYYSYDENEDGELSFDYGQNDRDQDSLSSSTNSMELDQVEESVTRTSTTEPAKENIERSSTEWPNFYKRGNAGSISAPIFPDKRPDPSEKIKELRPSSTRKFHTYVLPTPLDAKQSVSTGSIRPNYASRPGNKFQTPAQLWYSSPLESNKFLQNSRDVEMLNPTKFPKAHTTVLKQSNIYSSPIKMPPPLREEPPTRPHAGSDPKKIKRNAFSGPITSRHWSNPASMSPSRVQTRQPSLSPKRSPKISPPRMKSPTISELHELPRPPTGSTRQTRPTSLIGHSAPLVYREQELNKKTNVSPLVSHTASPLPTPPAAVHRSFSIPSRRMPLSPVAKFLKDPSNTDLSEDVASPPLTPISLKNIHPTSQVSESGIRATKSKETL